MKKNRTHFLLFAVIIFSALFNNFNANGQSNRNRLSALVQNARLNQPFAKVSLFSLTDYETAKTFTKNHTALLADASKLSALVSQQNKGIDIEIPFADGSVKTLSVVKTEIKTVDFELNAKNNLGTTRNNYNDGLHYRGIIDGDLNSIAAVSIFDNEIMILFSNHTGNYSLGKIRDNSGKYLLYNDRDVFNQPPVECATDYNSVKDVINNSPEKNGGNNSMVVACRVVKCYYEADFAMYQAFGFNTTATANYVTAIFNQKATIYANDGISIEISQIVVWTSTDPYASFTTTSTTNSAFITQTGSSFNGDMANLLTTRNLGGGIAQGFSGLCNKSQAHCTSMIYTTYSPFPTYTWTIMVITHEMGHLLGSRHTHACVWNGNNTAIDGCSGSVEGSCALPPNPSPGVGGTIMSYCHLTSSGINFNNGFGPQPGTLLLNNVNNAVCLTGSNAATPTGMATSAITSNSANLSWNVSPGATQYTVEYKLASASTYTVLGNFVTNSASLSGLIANTPYNWRVNADCSPFSADVNFTTTALSGCGVPGGLYASNVSSTTANLNWATFQGASTYKVRYRRTGTTAWTTVNSATSPKAVSGLLPSTQYEFQVKSKCNGVFTAFSLKKKFTTQSSAPPTNYCTSNGSNTSLEYINNATIGTINNTSGNNAGYFNYTSLSTSAVVGSTVNFSVTLFKSNSADVEYVTVFVDFTRDGDFDDAGETAYTGSGTQSTFTGSFTIPLTASIGQTRMRVSMQYGAAPPACGTFTYGEVEDYILNMTAIPRFENTAIEMNDETTLTISPVPAKDMLNIKIENSISENFTVEIYSVTGSLQKSFNLNSEISSIDISTLSNGIYQLRISGNEGDVLHQKFIKN